MKLLKPACLHYSSILACTTVYLRALTASRTLL